MLSNGATGTATVNLRNLGDARTLVLIDGRRVPAGDPRHWATDLNAIPTSLIQRVDVLTGGASAVYGSDALAGVVNFIMNDHFEGVQFEYHANGYNHEQHNTTVSSIVAMRAETNPAQFQVPGNVGLDGLTQDISMTMGGNFAGGKGNATVYFEYRHSDPVLQASRDFSACAIASTSTGYVCGGSSTSYQGRFIDINSGKSWTIVDAAGSVRPFSRDTDLYNFAPTNYYQVPDERYLANFFAHYDAFPNVRVYTELDFMDDKTVLQIAPSGSFVGPVYTLLDSNPLLSSAFKAAFSITPTTPGQILIGRRNVEGGGRQDVPRHTDYRMVIGAKGDVLDGNWDYDLWWQSGKVIYQDTYLHDFSIERTTRALNVVKGPNGLPVCASVLDGSDPQCVPWDIFHTGGVTQAALHYLETPGLQNGQTSQNVVGLHVTSDLGSAYGWKLPGARNGVGVALGVEHRTEKLSLDTDTAFSTADLAGQGGPVIGLTGQYTVNEAFAEVRLPILESQRWAEELAVNGSYRYSSYSTGPRANTFGLGAEWMPVKQARLRGTYQRAIRAANLIELFTAQGLSLFGLPFDPCGPTKSATVAQCQLTGLPPNLYGSALLDNPAGQGNLLQGGNVMLTPEKSTSYTAGIVLQPMPNLNATVDYWNIQVENTIGQVNANVALDTCLATGQLCSFIHRDSLGTLWLSGGGYVDGTNVNIGTTKTDGIDVTVNWTYRFESYGGLAVSFVGTWLDKFIQQQAPGLGSYNCAGLYGAVCGNPTPRWRHVLTTTWNTPWNWNAGFRWRYYDSVAIDASSSNPALAGDFNPVDGKIGARNYLDLFGQWNISKNFTLRGGVNNVFDRDPPLVSQQSPPYGNGNTYPQVYDTLGRNFFVNAQAKF
jgi:outer membrane receptor protein involved in Fe transport